MTHKARILLVEDEDAQRLLVAGILRGEGHDVVAVASAEAALEALETDRFELILSDWKLPGRNGYQLLQDVRERHEESAFIMVTAYGSIDLAVKAVRGGADDFLTKPFVREALLLAIERAGRARRLQDENRRLSEALGERDRLVDLVGRSPVMQKIFRRVTKIAGTDATVLLRGESGTGKELTARALHALSSRKEAPFIAVNCAAIPEGLIESEFFGAEKGAFTGADRTRMGRFEAAHGGTLFLDEIGELPVTLQPKLLRALQESTVVRVGGNREIAVDVRILAATNRDLQAEVAAGRFREDLFYRLNVVPIELPPLRERREDIPILVQHFLEHQARRHGVSIKKPPSKLLRALVDYYWPGNARELANVVERLVLLSDEGQAAFEDLPPEVRGEQVPGKASFALPAGGMDWEAHERDCLQQAMTLSAGNRSKAAKLLRLSYKTFLYRLEKHQLQ